MRGQIKSKIALLYKKSHVAATAIEYSLIAAGIALAIILAIFLLGDELLAVFQDIIAGFST